jgi:PilZ domain-containing protein
MSTDPVQLERRAGQRFDFNLPISIEFEGRTLAGCSQNLSARGVLLFSEANLPEGSVVQLIFTMPSEITLAESMRVRCRGRVLRSGKSACAQGNGVAVQLDAYQYLDTVTSETNVELTRASAHDSAPDLSGLIAR